VARATARPDTAGLSIVAAVAKLHGFRLTVEDNAPRPLRLRGESRRSTPTKRRATSAPPAEALKLR